MTLYAVLRFLLCGAKRHVNLGMHFHAHYTRVSGEIHTCYLISPLSPLSKEKEANP